MVLAILIFVLYFFVNSLGKNIAEESSISSGLGGWLATFLLLPFCVILTQRATKGTSTINFDQYTIAIKTFFNRFRKHKEPKRL